jgi:hypothetical protein
MRTPKTTGMGSVQHLTSGHVDMRGILKKLIRSIFCSLETDLNKNEFSRFLSRRGRYLKIRKDKD